MNFNFQSLTGSENKGIEEQAQKKCNILPMLPVSIERENTDVSAAYPVFGKCIITSEELETGKGKGWGGVGWGGGGGYNT